MRCGRKRELGLQRSSRVYCRRQNHGLRPRWRRRRGRVPLERLYEKFLHRSEYDPAAASRGVDVVKEVAVKVLYKLYGRLLLAR